jgi:hypothetical protein
MKDTQVGAVLVMVVDDQLDGERVEDGRKNVYEKWFTQSFQFSSW